MVQDQQKHNEDAEELFELAQTYIATGKIDEAFEILRKFIELPADQQTDSNVILKERSIMAIAKLFAERKQAKEFEELIQYTRPFLSTISKAKAAKIIKELVDLYLKMALDAEKEIQLLKGCVEWAREEKRVYLRMSLEVRLVTLLYEKKRYAEAAESANSVLYELKKLDEKFLQVEVLLTESRTYFALDNVSKSRAALVSARTTANSIYTPPYVQASLDLQSGILHAAEDIDFKTAYSYFYESFEAFNNINDTRAMSALKYMMLAKIMLGHPSDLTAIIDNNVALKYGGKDLEALQSIGKASADKSLVAFQQALSTYKVQLVDDPIIFSHLDTLYNKMLEDNLSRIIEPYSRIQVDRVATMIGLSRRVVETKLSQMILDKMLHGILDQETGSIILFESNAQDKTYESALECISQLNDVVDALFERAKKLQ